MSGVGGEHGGCQSREPLALLAGLLPFSAQREEKAVPKFLWRGKKEVEI